MTTTSAATSLPDGSVKLAVSTCRVASTHDRVDKTECVYTFHSPFTTEQGIVVNLQTFCGTVQELAFGGGGGKTGEASEAAASAAAAAQEEEGLFVRIVQQRVPKTTTTTTTTETETKTNETTAAPTKLGIGVEGGFASEQDKYEIKSSYSVVHLKKDNKEIQVVAEVPYLEETKNDAFPMIVVQSVDSILNHAGSTLQQDVAVWQLDQEQDIPVSKYATADLPFVDNGVTISPHAKDWKCQKSGDTDNVWLNLSTGYMGGGRRHWDGSGGSNGALDHYHDTGKKYPLVVKLGTITADISTADCYSYAPDEDGPVKVPNLAELLQKRGILAAGLQKTVKSTAELEVELNANYAFDAICEKGFTLKPVTGPALQGLQNLGNSCYLNSVVQLLCHLPEWHQRYGGGGSGKEGGTPDSVTNHALFSIASPTQAPTNVLIQTTKLALAIMSGVFSRPTAATEEEESETSNDPKYRLAPRMFKHVIGKDHVEFRTGQQQDAAQFLQYFLQLLDRAEQAQKELLLRGMSAGEDAAPPFCPSSHWLSFATETRSVCTADGKVKYDGNTQQQQQQRETIWSLPLPMDLATLPDAAMKEASEEKQEPDTKRPKTGTGGDTDATTTDAAATGASSPASDDSQNTAATASTESPPEPVPHLAFDSIVERWAAETTVEDIAWQHLQGAKHAAQRTTKLLNFPKYLLVQLQRYMLGPDWQPVKIQVEVQFPTEDDGTTFVVDLAKYKSTGVRPSNEVLVPETTTEAETSAPAAQTAAASAPAIDEAAVAQLQDMGFSRNACLRALRAVGGTNVEAAMGWVFEHNTDPDFNDPLPQEGAATAAAGSGSGAEDGIDDAVVQSLVEMLGCFTADQVRFGLKQTNGASDRAADWLFSHMDELDALMIAAASSEQSPSEGASTSSPSSLPPLDDSTGDDNATSTYQLTGLISHIGKHTGSGHYVAHLLIDGKWIIFNDEKVAESAKPPVEHAYLYLLQRTDTL